MTSNSVISHLAIGLIAFALAWAIATEQGSAGNPNDQAIFDREPTVALAAILRVENAGERATLLAAFLDQTDPSVAMILHEMLRERDSDLIIDEMAEILLADWWATSDPENAFRNPVDPGWEGRHPWMRTVLKHWTRQDPVAAAMAVQSLPPNPIKGRLDGSRVVVDEWISLDSMPDPRPLLAVIRSLEPMARASAIEHVIESMIKTDGVDQSLDFVRSIRPDNNTPGGSVHNEFLARTGVVLLNEDLDMAVSWAEEQRDGPNSSGVHKHLAYYWGLRDGPAALKWALALPSDLPQKSATIKRAWMSFARRHREEATDWLLTHPPSPLMRGTYTKFLETLAKTEPQSALELAEKTVDPELRNIMRASAAEGWMKVDPTAALAWLKGAGLPPKLSAQVRRAGAEAGPPKL
jgi:hypothetical protein